MCFRITAEAIELVEPHDITSFSVACTPELDHQRLAEKVQRAGLGELLPDDRHMKVSVETSRHMATGRIVSG